MVLKLVMELRLNRKVKRFISVIVFVFIIIIQGYSRELNDFSLYIGTSYKNLTGTTFVRLGYNISAKSEFYLAPTFGLIFKGNSIISGYDFTLNSEKKTSLVFDANLRHILGQTMVVSNETLDGFEKYNTTYTDFLVFGVGIRTLIFTKMSDIHPNKLKVFFNYNLKVYGDDNPTFIDGISTAEGFEYVKKKLSGGFGISIVYGSNMHRMPHSPQ